MLLCFFIVSEFGWPPVLILLHCCFYYVFIMSVVGDFDLFLFLYTFEKFHQVRDIMCCLKPHCFTDEASFMFNSNVN